MIKFQRNYLLTVQNSIGQLIQISMPLTLEFHVTHNILASTNVGTFRIYNLNRAVRDSIYRDQFNFNDVRSLKLQAGYGDGTLPTIFNGNITKAYSARPRGAVDFITEIEGYDLNFPVVKSFSNFTMSPTDFPTVTRKMVINQLVSDMQKNTPEGLLGVGFIGNFPGTYPRGRTVFGPSWDVLQTETNKSCYIYKGRINCLSNDEAIEGSIKVINSETGLLSTPRRTQQNLSVDVLFEPNLEMSQTVLLESSSSSKFDGLYKVIGIDHRGVISGAVAGDCITTITLNYGNKIFSLISQQGLQLEGVLG